MSHITKQIEGQPQVGSDAIVRRCGRKQSAKWRAWDQGEAAVARKAKLTDNPYIGVNAYLAAQWTLGFLAAKNPPPERKPSY
jgi:hypothetical protein